MFLTQIPVLFGRKEPGGCQKSASLLLPYSHDLPIAAIHQFKEAKVRIQEAIKRWRRYSLKIGYTVCPGA